MKFLFGVVVMSLFSVNMAFGNDLPTDVELLAESHDLVFKNHGCHELIGKSVFVWDKNTKVVEKTNYVKQNPDDSVCVVGTRTQK